MADHDDITKRCSKCGEEKPHADFYVCRAATDGLQRWCKLCSRKHAAETDAAIKQARKISAARHRARHLAGVHSRIAITKRCPQCGITTDQFAVQISRADGRRGFCRTCHRANNAAYRKAHPDKARAAQAAWRAANPERSRAIKAAWQAANPGKEKSTGAAWKLANADHVKAFNAAYRAANKAKIAKKQATYQAATRDKRAAYVLANADSIKAGIAAWGKANPERLRALSHKRRARIRGAPGSWGAADIQAIRRMQRDKCAVCGIPLKGKGHRDHIVALAKGGSNDRRNLQLLCKPCNSSKHARDPIEFMQSRGFLL